MADGRDAVHKTRQNKNQRAARPPPPKKRRLGASRAAEYKKRKRGAAGFALVRVKLQKQVIIGGGGLREE